MLDFPSSLPSEVSQQTARNDPSSYQIKAAAALSDCETASSSTCTSARRRAETLDSTARTRPRLHVRDDDADACFVYIKELTRMMNRMLIDNGRR